MGGMDYKEYMNSWMWQDKKKWIFENKKDLKGFVRCEHCLFPFKNWQLLTLHHLNYDCVGSERMKDLEIVCHQCHKKIHNIKLNEKDLKTIKYKKRIKIKNDFDNVPG